MEADNSIVGFPDQNLNVYYLGEDAFSRKLISALFMQHGLSVKESAGAKFPVGSLILADASHQLVDPFGLAQVYLSNHPLRDNRISYWCKTPLNESGIDNILFYCRSNRSRQPSAESPDFSLSKIENFVGNDPAALRDVVAEFIDNLSTNFRLLCQAATRNDLAEMRDTAHKMMSSVSYYEVEQLSGMLKNLEDETAPIEKPSLITLLESLEADIARLRNGLIHTIF